MVQVKKIEKVFNSVWDNQTMENKINMFLSTLRDDQFVGINFLVYPNSRLEIAYIMYKTDKPVP